MTDATFGQTKKRGWVRALVILAVLVGVVAALRNRQFAANEKRYPGTDATGA